MKKITFIVLILTFILYSCVNNKGDNSSNSLIQNNSKIEGCSIVVIDSCEYIQYRVYYYEAITHKGNCKFCIERNKKLYKHKK